MLIACSGPDVFRALEKARELEAAFCQKYDPEGSSIERLAFEGAELIEAVVERANTVSLFTPRRFLRARDLLRSCPKARLSALQTALSVDPDNVIVVTVETEPLTESLLKVCTTIPKWVNYEFPFLEGRALEQFIRERAAVLKLTLSDQQLQQIVEQTQGNSWQVGLRLLQLQAGVELSATRASDDHENRTLFDWADAYLKQDPYWPTALQQFDADVLLYPFLSQLRSYERVQAGQDSNLPSFVVRKLRGLNAPAAEEHFARLLEALLLQRQGFLREDELDVLF